MVAVSVDAAKFSTASSYFRGEVQVTFADNAKGCQAAAQKADCGGFSARAFMYTNNSCESSHLLPLSPLLVYFLSTC